MKKESKVIVFTGGCFAGKTTTLDSVSTILTANGKNVVYMNEYMRNKPIVSIDEIRSDPSTYLKLQDEIVRLKMLRENEIFQLRDNVIALIDRAITDSLFYLLYYVDKSKMSLEDLKTYNNLIADAQKHAAFAFKNIYDYVAFFLPIEKISDAGIYRPETVHITKYIESSVIGMLNYFYYYEHGNANMVYKTYNANIDDHFEIAKDISSWYIKL